MFLFLLLLGGENKNIFSNIKEEMGGKGPPGAGEEVNHPRARFLAVVPSRKKYPQTDPNNF